MRKRSSKDILDLCVSGYHEYVLREPYHLQYVSRSLCHILKYTKEELLSDTADLLAPLIHPADSERYRAFLHALAEREQTKTIRYRIVDRDGKVRCVTDTITSRRSPSGEMTGYAVLSDTTDVPDEDGGMQLLQDNVPCGLLRYTCEKNPRVTYASPHMAKMLGIRPEDPESMKQLEFYRNNIYLAVAAENRKAFSRVLHAVYLKKRPMVGEVTVIRADGSRARLFGWIMKYRSPEGREEFQTICVDITGQYKRKKNRQSDQYLQALSEVYDYIFEYDRETRMMRCLKKGEDAGDSLAVDLPMKMEDATTRWINTAASDGEREKLRGFLRQYAIEGTVPDKELPVRISFHLTEQGLPQAYQGILLQGDGEMRYFCCKKQLQAAEPEQTAGPERRHVFIRTFGYFDVFVDDRPVMFRNEKAKELFALLVDRRGGYVSASEAIGILWEDEPASPVVLSRYRKVALRLKNLLEEYGISDIVEYVNGQRRLIVEKAECDLFTYLAQDPAKRQPFSGNYLTNYSWGEVTLGELMNL